MTYCFLARHSLSNIDGDYNGWNQAILRTPNVLRISCLLQFIENIMHALFNKQQIFRGRVAEAASSNLPFITLTAQKIWLF